MKYLVYGIIACLFFLAWGQRPTEAVAPGPTDYIVRKGQAATLWRLYEEQPSGNRILKEQYKVLANGNTVMEARNALTGGMEALYGVVHTAEPRFSGKTGYLTFWQEFFINCRSFTTGGKTVCYHMEFRANGTPEQPEDGPAFDTEGWIGTDLTNRYLFFGSEYNHSVAILSSVDVGATYPNSARMVANFDARRDALTVYGLDAKRLLNLRGSGGNDRASIRFSGANMLLEAHNGLTWTFLP